MTKLLPQILCTNFYIWLIFGVQGLNSCLIKCLCTPSDDLTLEDESEGLWSQGNVHYDSTKA